MRFRHCPRKYSRSTVCKAIRHGHVTYTNSAHSRSPRYWSRCLPRRQASAPARRCPGRLHLLFRLHQDPREHPQGHLRRRLQHLRLPHPQPVEGDQAHQEPARGVQRRPEGRQEVLSGFMSGARVDGFTFHGFLAIFKVQDVRPWWSCTGSRGARLR